MKKLKQKMYKSRAASIETHLKGNGDDKLRTVSAFHEIPEGVLDLFSNTAGLTEFLELRFNVGSASDYLKNSFAFIETTSFNQTVGSVHNQKSTQCEKHCRDAGRPQ